MPPLPPRAKPNRIRRTLVGVTGLRVAEQSFGCALALAVRRAMMRHAADSSPRMTAPSIQSAATPAAMPSEPLRPATPADGRDEALRMGRIKAQQLALAGSVAEKAVASRLVRSAIASSARSAPSAIGQASQQAWAAATRYLIEVMVDTDDGLVASAGDVEDERGVDANDTDDADGSPGGVRPPDAVRRLGAARGAAERRRTPHRTPPRPPLRKREPSKRSAGLKVEGDGRGGCGQDDWSPPAVASDDAASRLDESSSVAMPMDHAAIARPSGLQRIEPLQALSAPNRQDAAANRERTNVIAWASVVIVGIAAVAAIMMTMFDGPASSEPPGDDRRAQKESAAVAGRDAAVK
jgi:hypothetical protein